MYEAAEDSELLAQAVRQHAKGEVLDLGTGSGMLADVAHAMGLDVTAVDIDLSVVERLKGKQYTVMFSDRFSALQRKKFDTIICNPPYLPNDTKGDERDDRRLYGGKKGYEYIVQVIKESKFHLNANGQMLFLISTMTRPLVVERALRQEGYEWEVVAEMPLFMEKLLVYRAKLVLGRPAELIGRGKRSLVYGYDDVAVKFTTPLRAQKEAMMLCKVNEQHIGPRYRKHEEGRLYMQRITGEPFSDYLLRTKDLSVACELLEQVKKLDEMGIRKHELNRPGKNILVTADKQVVLLDFERSVFQPQPNNVTQLAAWLALVLHRDIKHALERYKRGDISAYEDIVHGLCQE